MLLNFEKHYQLYQLLTIILNISKNFTLLTHLLPVFHLLCFSGLLFLEMSEEIYSYSQTMADLLRRNQKIYFSIDTANWYSFIGNLVNFYTIILASIMIKYMGKYDQINPHKKLLNILIFMGVIGFYVSQIIIYLITWAFCNIYYQEGLTSALLKCLFPFLFFTLLNVWYEGASLYGLLTIPMILSISLSTNLVFCIIVLLSLSYLLIVRKTFTQKLCILLSIFLILFVVMNSQSFLNYHKLDKQLSTIALLCFGIMILLTVIIFIRFQGQLFQPKSEQILNSAFEVISELKDQIPYNLLPFKAYYKLFSNFQNILPNRDDQSKIQHIILKNPQQFTKKDFFTILQYYLERQFQSQTINTAKLILLVKARIHLNYPITKILTGFYSIKNKIQHESHRKIYEFMKLFELIRIKYAIFKIQDLETSRTLHGNRLSEKFQTFVKRLLGQISEFWNQISLPQVKKVSLQIKLFQIIKQKEQIDIIYRQLHLYQSLNQKRIVMQRLEQILNPYHNQMINSSQVNFSQNQEQNLESMSFVIIQNNKIDFASKEFHSSIFRDNKVNYRNMDKKLIFGNEMYCIIDQLIHNIGRQSQKQWKTIPVLCKQHCIKLQKIKILWLPSPNAQKWMIKFAQDQEFVGKAYVIYDCKTGTIRYFNELFLDTFKINQQKLTRQMGNTDILFNQIFFVQNSTLNKTQKFLIEVGTKIECKLYLKRYVQKGSIQIYDVQIDVSKSYHSDNQPAFCLLTVQAIKGGQQIHDIQKIESTNKIVLFQNKQVIKALNRNSIIRKHQNQKFFCKLPNQYEDAIIQKQQRLMDQSRITYLKVINCLFLMLVILLGAFWATQGDALLQAVDYYRGGLKAIQNTSEQYVLLYEIYSIALKRYYIQMFPLKSQTIQNTTAQILDSNYKQAEGKLLREFLQRYLIQIHDQASSAIEYQIDFSTFTIQTDSQKTTLMDFAQNIKRNIMNNEIEFMIKNYDNFRQLTADYQSALNYNDLISGVIGQDQMIWFIINAWALLLLIGIILVLHKLQTQIDMVYFLVEKIDCQHIEDHYKKFNMQKKTILECLDRFSHTYAFSKQREDKIHLQTGESNEISETQNFKPAQFQCQNLLLTDQLNQNCYSMRQSTMTIENQEGINIQKPYNKNKISANKEKVIIKEPFIQKSLRILPFIVLILAVIGILIFDLYYLSYQKHGMIQISEMFSQFYISLLHIKRYEVDAIIIPTLRHYYQNSQIQPPYFRQNITLVTPLPSKIKLDQLGNFDQKAFDILSSNICIYAGTYAKNALKPCQSYLGGMVAKGFRSTLEKYIQNSKQVADQTLEEFGKYTCTQQKCPEYYENQFVSILMGETLRTLIRLLNEDTEIAFDRLFSYCMRRIELKYIGLSLVCILYVLYWKYMKQRCRTSLRFFSILPKRFTCSLKMAIYLKKSQFFEKIYLI